jgi:hypothetical protein
VNRDLCERFWHACERCAQHHRAQRRAHDWRWRLPAARALLPEAAAILALANALEAGVHRHGVRVRPHAAQCRVPTRSFTQFAWFKEPDANILNVVNA